MNNTLHSQQAENRLLGILINDYSQMRKIAGLLEPTDFFIQENQNIFKAIDSCIQKGYDSDLTFLIEELRVLSNKSPSEWMNYFSTLTLEKGIVSNIENYVNLILEKRQARDLKSTLEDSSKKVDIGGATVFELIDQVETKIQDITKTRELKDFEPIENLTNEYLLKMQKIAEDGIQTGIKTGISLLDESIGGFQPGQLVIIAARPSMGKTAFALEMAKGVARKKKVGFFSLEMPADQLILRLMSSEAKINSRKIFQQNNVEQLDQQKQMRIDAAKESVKKLNMRIDDSASLKISELVWKARKAKETDGLDMIIIDYLQLIDSNAANTESRQQVISDISRQLKALARDLEIPVIALSQLSRRVESREDKKPMMSDIRESGAIEQDADIIMFLYREDYYKKAEHKTDSQSSDLEVLIRKNRNGKTEDLKMKIHLEYGSIHL